MHYEKRVQSRPIGDILARAQASLIRPAAKKKTLWRGLPGEQKPMWAILGDEPPIGWLAPDPGPEPYNPDPGFSSPMTGPNPDPGFCQPIPPGQATGIPFPRIRPFDGGQPFAPPAVLDVYGPPAPSAGLTGEKPTPIQTSQKGTTVSFGTKEGGFATAGTRIRPPNEAATNREPGLYVTGHRVFGIGPTHTAIEYVPEDGSDPFWISAGPEDGRLVSGVGTPDNGVRDSDRPENNFTLGTITPPEGMSRAEYAQQLRDANREYRDNVDYDVFADNADGVNSNGFVRGLLDYTGGSSPVDFDGLTGGESPLLPEQIAPPLARHFGYSVGQRTTQPPSFRRLP